MRARAQYERVCRKGGVAVIFAAFLPVFIGLIALSIDVAVIATARTKLSATADAAALAGARLLFTDNRLSGGDVTADITAADSGAVSIARSNTILGRAAVLIQNGTNSATSDIFVGYLDTSSTTSSVTTNTAAGLYNAVQARIGVDANRGGIIPSFFAGVDGFKGASLSATSVAIGRNYQVSGFSSGSTGSNAQILPIALDQTTYNAMIAGNPLKLTTTGLPLDQYAYSSSTGQVTSGSDGIYESCLYPVSNGSPGNWGTVKVGVSNNSTSTLGAQIVGGITPAQLATFPGGTIQLSSATTPPSLTLSANPGISAGLKSSIDAIIGQTRFIPIYSSVSGNGNNTTYTIVKFAGVRVMADNFQGNPKYVIVQPAFVNDATAIPSSAESSWSNGGLVYLRLAR